MCYVCMMFLEKKVFRLCRCVCILCMYVMHFCYGCMYIIYVGMLCRLSYVRMAVCAYVYYGCTYACNVRMYVCNVGYVRTHVRCVCRSVFLYVW